MGKKSEFMLYCIDIAKELTYSANNISVIRIHTYGVYLELSKASAKVSYIRKKIRIN